MKKDVHEGLKDIPGARLTGVLGALDVPRASWYRKPVPRGEGRKPGPKPVALPPQLEQAVVSMATTNPWYGYKRIAVMCRRAGVAVSDRKVYQVMKRRRLLQRKRRPKAQLYQAKKLWELLPKRPNELWQMDVTYVHIPGFGWYYAVTVIDYYSRYLLAARLSASYCAVEVIAALQQARAEAERLCGPLKRMPFLVTDNGSSFIARRFGAYLQGLFRHVRIRYRTPQQLGLLERFHRTLKDEEVYWRMYRNPQHARDCIAEFRERYNRKRPHWALRPESGGDPFTPEEVYVGGLAIQIPRWQAWARAAKAKLDQMLADESRAAS